MQRHAVASKVAVQPTITRGAHVAVVITVRIPLLMRTKITMVALVFFNNSFTYVTIINENFKVYRNCNGREAPLHKTNLQIYIKNSILRD